MDPKKVDNELRKADLEAAEMWERDLEEMKEAAAAKMGRAMRSGGLELGVERPADASQTESDYTKRFRKHIGNFGIQAMVKREDGDAA